MWDSLVGGKSPTATPSLLLPRICIRKVKSGTGAGNQIHPSDVGHGCANQHLDHQAGSLTHSTSSGRAKQEHQGLRGMMSERIWQRKRKIVQATYSELRKVKVRRQPCGQ